MAFVCAGNSYLNVVSGEIPDDPVVSLVSKNIFERRILEKFVNSNGKDPITDEPMTMEDVVSIKTADILPPKLSSQTSIPSILKTFQQEWDAFVLQNFMQSKQLQSLKQELSISLFQLDSSCRIIAKLLKENEELKKNVHPAENIQKKMDVEDVEKNSDENSNDLLDSELSEKISALSTQLTTSRKTVIYVFIQKNKNPPSDLAQSDQISSFKLNLHSASKPGILSLDLRPLDSRIVTGGNDKCAVVFDLKNDQIITTLKGHTKKVTHTVFHPSEPLIVTGSADTQIRVWEEDRPRSLKIIKSHSGPITGLSFHPLGTHVLTTGADHVRSDINMGTSLAKQSHQTYQFLSSHIHPDGLIFSTGTDAGPILIWDFKSCKNVAKFESHTDSVIALSFSENGYHLASASSDGTLRLWDLRKTKCANFVQYESQNLPFTSLAFDETGQYLSIGGNDIQIYAIKKWEKISSLSGLNFDLSIEQIPVSSLKFGFKAQSLVSVGLDRALRVYSN